MLKKRIIPILLLKKGRLVKGCQFDNYRDVGDPVKSAGVYSSQQADELIILNTQGGSITPLLEIIEPLCAACFMPLSLGGGIRSEADAAKLIAKGADKVVLNSLCYQSPADIKALSNRFGRQAVVCAIDVRYSQEKGDYQLFSHNGSQPQAVSLQSHVQTLIEHGAGEIMIQSIDRDGGMQGFDIELIATTRQLAATLPIIAAGGSGNYEHLKALFLSTDVDAVVCGSLFNFSDSNPIRAKAFLQNYDIPFKKV